MFDSLYVGGCSLTAGGGLHVNHVIKKYKELHNVEWNNLHDILYPKILANNLGLKYHINDAKSGSGIGRLVRRTYEYIKKHGIHSSQRTIFFLQINDSFNRVEYYSKKLNDYLIINPQWNDDMSLKSVAVADGWYENEKTIMNYFFKDEEIYFDDFMRKYHDPISYSEKCYFDLIGLFCFLKNSKIKFFYCVDIDFFGGGFELLRNEFSNNRIIIDGYQSINSYCGFNKLRICDDIENWSDEHPGYFGHQKFGNNLAEEIKKRL
jgi:hypothetical protein